MTWKSSSVSCIHCPIQQMKQCLHMLWKHNITVIIPGCKKKKKNHPCTPAISQIQQFVWKMTCNENHLLLDSINSVRVWRLQDSVLCSSLWSTWKTSIARHAERCRISCHSQMFPCRCSQRSLSKENLFAWESCAYVCHCSHVRAEVCRAVLNTPKIRHGQKTIWKNKKKLCILMVNICQFSFFIDEMYCNLNCNVWHCDTFY